MKKSKVISVLLVVAMVVAMMAGCSSKQETITTATADTAATTTDTSATTTATTTDTSADTTSDAVNANTTDVTEANDTVETTTDVVEPKLPEVINAAVLKGPTAIGMVNLMSKNDAGESKLKYDFTIAGAADEIAPQLIKGNLQIAAVPANLASVLYNKTEGGIRVAAINNLGVLYVLETGEEIKSVEDLRGRTIYTTGQGTTPEYTLRYLLKMAGIDPDKDVTIEFKSEAAEVATILAAAEDDVVAMLPQPYVTVAMTKSDKVRVALDVTEEWDKLAGADSTVVTGVIVVNAAFADEYPEAVKLFLAEYEESAGLANSDIEGTAALIEGYDIFKAAVAMKAIPKCNITYVDGAKMQQYISAYLKVLYDENPASVGGKLPADDFYYGVVY